MLFMLVLDIVQKNSALWLQSELEKGKQNNYEYDWLLN